MHTTQMEMSAARKSPYGRFRSIGAIGASLLILLLVIAAGAALAARHLLRQSLPRVRGRLLLPGLSAPVVIARDRLGVPALFAANRLDLARATGFVHAQERFFQMDLERREAAGELAELLGGGVAERDRQLRLHRFRAEARRILEAAPPAERALVLAYTAGVNAGLGGLDAAPFEYFVLHARPRRWAPDDTYLVALWMFLGLQSGSGSGESRLGLMHDVLPPPLFAFLTPGGTEWDSPLLGPPLPPPAPLPGPRVLDLRHTAIAAAGDAGGGPPAPLPPVAEPPPAMAGSNAWAVAASRAAGGALLACDMHVGLTVPNLWYRAALRWQPPGGAAHAITGVTLPGVPMVVAGSNTHLAWGFTNSFADTSDLVVIDVDPVRPEIYRTPQGARAMTRDREIIQVRGGPDRALDVLGTIWGPIVDHDHRGRARALRWVAHEAGAVNLELAALEDADGVAAALQVAKRSGMPAQNVLVADEHGHIGWTVAGRLPRRIGFDGRLPESWSDGRRRWDGLLEPADVPQLMDPPEGLLWTANNRLVGGADLARLGDGGYLLGARAAQIHGRLVSLRHATARDMLAIQLDDEALFLRRWQLLLLRSLTPAALAADPRRREMRSLVESWGGHAATDSVGYALVRMFRLAVAKRVFSPLLAACQRADPRFSFVSYLAAEPQYEGPLWQLVTTRPAHLLDPRFHSWDELLVAAADAGRDTLLDGGLPLREETWGQLNRSHIQHPLAGALPGIGHWLDMPSRPLPGDVDMPRFQTPSMGASERMVVSPGREREGWFEMPCGESGHPLSRHYRDEYDDWCAGRPSPLLPGPAVDRLVLEPLPAAVQRAAAARER